VRWLGGYVESWLNKSIWLGSAQLEIARGMAQLAMQGLPQLIVDVMSGSQLIPHQSKN